MYFALPIRPPTACRGPEPIDAEGALRGLTGYSPTWLTAQLKALLCSLIVFGFSFAPRSFFRFPTEDVETSGSERKVAAPPRQRSGCLAPVSRFRSRDNVTALAFAKSQYPCLARARAVLRECPGPALLPCACAGAFFVLPAPEPVLCECPDLRWTHFEYSACARAVACVCAGAFFRNEHVSAVDSCRVQCMFRVSHLWWTCLYKYSTLVSITSVVGLFLQAQCTCVSCSHLRWTSSEKQNALVFIFGEIESQFEHCLECCKKLL